MSRHMNDGMYSSGTDEWETPQGLFDSLDREFGFTLDVCATEKNAKCRRYFTKDDDGLIQDWGRETVWCNPPYGRELDRWILRCSAHAIGGGTAVMLIPARTDTQWFHDYVYGKAEIRFLRGRIRFGGSKWNAPFPSMVAVFRPKKEKRRGDGQIRMEI